MNDPDDLLPDVTDDERAVGWGDDWEDGDPGAARRSESGERHRDGGRDDEWYLRERPPHWE